MKIYFECECGMFVTRPCFIFDKLQQCLFVWWWLTPLSTIFQVVSFIGWREPEYPEKTPTCRKSLTNLALSHKVVYLALIKIKLTTAVVIGTNSIGSCKSNYHTNALLNWYLHFFRWRLRHLNQLPWRI